MRALIVSCAILLAAAAQAQTDPAVRAARNLIDDGRPAEALAALDAINASGASSRAQARIWFYKARAYEDLGDRQKAIDAYETAVRTEPAYGAALNNLAQLLSERGDGVRAAALLKNAVAIADDPRRPLYLANYAAMSEKNGDVGTARSTYAELAALQPDNVEAQLNAIRLLDDPKRIALLLGKLSNRGEVSAAQSLALDLLAKPFDAAGKRAMLSVVAGTLAAQHAAAPPPRLEDFRRDPAIGDGVAEILQLYAGMVDPAQYRWWRSPEPDPHFAALIREVGRTSKAEGYFKLALDYSNGTDPDAAIELADLWYAQKRIADIDSLIRTTKVAGADYAAEYRFHVALGTMYAYVDRWGDEHTPASAIFQLTEARRAAADYNRTIKWGPRIQSDPQMLDLLATAYEKSNRRDDGVALRIEAAESFAAEGRKSGAAIVLKPIKADPSMIADAAYRQRYADVTKTLAAPRVIEQTIEFPDAINVTIVSLVPGAESIPAAYGQRIARLIYSYVTAETDRDRDWDEDTLRKLGVSDLEPTTMSRTTGEMVVSIGGKPTRYRYTVRSQ